MKIKKVSGTAVLNGNVIDNLTGNSTTNAPSQRAVKEYIKDIYSTEEVKTNKVWIDGKPIYRKIIDFGTLPNSSAKGVQHGIQNLKNLIFIGGVVTNTAGTSFVLPSYRANDINGIEMWITTTEVTIVTGSDRTNATAYITLEYTKTTDV